jgi:hypothetical protein
MSIENSVTLIDGNTNNVLVISIPVFKDDLIMTIKEKIFSLSHFLSPELLVLTTKNLTVLEDDKYLYEYQEKKGDKIWIYNVLSIKKTKSLSEIRDMWDRLSLEESSIIYNHLLYDEKLEYNKLINGYKSNHDNFDFGIFEKDKRVFDVKINPDLLYKEKNGNIYKKIKNSVVILNINKSLDLSIVFKHLELDENIPFIIYKENIKKNASVKILKTLPKELVKEWSLQETKGIKGIRGGKGLTFRIKNGDGYSIVNISNKIITIKCDFTNSKQNTKTCIAGIGEGLDKINNIHGFEIISQNTKSFSAELIVNTFFGSMDFALQDFDIFFDYAPVPEKERVSDVIHLKYQRAIKPIDIFIRTLQDRKSITIQTESDTQLDLILSRLLKLISGNDFKVLDNTMQEISNVKKLQKIGGITDTVSCQKGRQPKIDADFTPLGDSYDMVYKDKRYICPVRAVPFPYPGFTSKGIPCCFKKDQRTKTQYNEILNPSKIQVYPSNLPITIDRQTYLVLKDESGDYLYIDNEGKTVSIDYPDILEKIKSKESEGNIWMNLSPINTLLNKTIASRCSDPPLNIFKRTCKKQGIFGYHKTGEPCCFTNQKDIFVEKDTNTRHIITTDKILGPSRTGELYDDLKGLFTPDHFRIGILQSDFSFIHAVVNAIGINTTTEKMLSFIKTELTESVYESLFGISEVFSFSQYKNYFSEKWVDHKLAIEFISRIFRVNIIVLNHNESSISCTMNLIDTPFNESYQYIVLIKNNKTYEPIKKNKPTEGDALSPKGSLKTNNGQGTFPKSEVQKLIDLYTFSCKAIKPENFPLNLKELLKVVPEPKKVSQVINSSRLVNFVKYNDSFIIPVKVSKPLSGTIGEDKMILYEADHQIENLNKLDIPELKVKGQILSSQGKIIAIITESDLVLPVRQGQRIEDLTILNLNYYDNINEILQLNKKIDDERVLNVLDRIVYEEYTNRVHYVISEFLKDNDELKDELVNIKSIRIDRKLKVEMLRDIIKPIVNSLFSSNKFDTKSVKITDSYRKNCPSFSDKDTCNIKDYCIWDGKCSLKSILNKDDIILNIIQSILKSNAIIDGISNEMISAANFITRKSEITFINTEQIDRWLV